MRYGKDYISFGSTLNVTKSSCLLYSVQFAVGAGLGVKISDHLVVYGRHNVGLTDATTTFYDQFDIKTNFAPIGIAA